MSYFETILITFCGTLTLVYAIAWIETRLERRRQDKMRAD